MTKFPVLKCPICAKPYREVGTFGNHMRHEHPGTIPEGWSDLRYAYFVHTGRSHGKCRECGGDTPWNETTGAYGKICTKEACKKAYRDRFMQAMRRKYHKDNLFDEPGFRERQLAGRRISGKYTFQDGTEVQYVGKLEEAFLKMLDTFFHFPASDIIAPSPNRYVYYYSNPNDTAHEGEHVYIPDFYIPSINLEIELKTSTNKRPKNLLIDVVKDACKDVYMIQNPLVNYVKVYEDDYHVFFQIFADFARYNGKPPYPIKYISRALIDSPYRDYIPDSLLTTLDRYIYKYSPKSVLRKRPIALEAETVDDELPELVDEEPEEDAAETSETSDILEAVYNENDDSDEDVGLPLEDGEDDDVGINPLMYYGMGEFANPTAGAEVSEVDEDDEDAVVSQKAFTFFDEDTVGPVLGDWSAMESIFTKVTDGDSIDARAANRYGRWRDKLFGTKLFGTRVAKLFTKVEFVDGRIVIRGINCNLLLYRIKERYSETKLKYIFEYRYNATSWKMYQKKKIGRGDMKIDYVYAPEFFAIELVDLFRDLGNHYNDNSYRRIAELIYESSWMAKSDSQPVTPLSLEPLANLDGIELMDHQKEFISQWPVLKNQLNLNGYILAFKPGKGKTVTAVGLAECIRAKRVYIVCPNNLKDNWALELRKYFRKYQENDDLWKKDVCILGSFGNPKTARYVITNNENIKLMMPHVDSDPDAMLIIDECHNFRNYGGTRSKELFDLADKLGSHNVLCVSATPIKAVPAEITPALRIIDPTFSDEAAAMYNRAFDLNNDMAMSIVSKRFGMIMYRSDAQVDLPPKETHPLGFHVSNEERYYLTTTHDEIVARFKELQDQWQKSSRDEIENFRQSIYRYAITDRKHCDRYMDWVLNASSSLRGADDKAYHELSVKEYKSFLETYVRTNIKCPIGEAQRLEAMEREFVTAAKRSMGLAIGEILPKRRAEMFSKLYLENREEFYKMIQKRGKKTVIFSTIVSVVDTVTEDLNQFGIKAVSVTGNTKNRLDVLNQFKDDPTTLVLVATSQSLGVGVTLTEASQMFFLGTPWRDTDLEQASDRIWRIGQTDPVDIYIVRTISQNRRMKNLSDRMDEILQWSARMFGMAMASADNGEDLVAMESEAYQLAEEVMMRTWNGHGQTFYFGNPDLYSILSMMQSQLEHYQYGMLYNGRIIQPTDPMLYDKYYRTMSPGKFFKVKGGLCFDFAAYEDHFLRTHGISAFTYFVSVAEINMTHMFVCVEDGDQVIYPESAFSNCMGIHVGHSLNEVVSWIVKSMLEFSGHSEIKNPTVTLIALRAVNRVYDESPDELFRRIKRSGKVIPFRYDPNVLRLRPLEFNDLTFDGPDAMEALLPENGIPERYDGLTKNEQYYGRLSDGEMATLNIIMEAVGPLEGTGSRRPEPGIPAGTAWDNCRMVIRDGLDHMNCADVFYNIHQRLRNRVGFVSLVFEISYPKLGKNGPLLLPMNLVPFRNGALLLYYGVTPTTNGIFMVDDVQKAASFVAFTTLAQYDIGYNERAGAEITGYEVTSEDVDSWPSLTIREAHDRLVESKKSFSVIYDPKTVGVVPEVEVLTDGWLLRS